MRLIDADKAKAMLKPYEKLDESWMCTGWTAIRLIHNAIDNAPTVDAVPVVRCKECIHFDPDDEDGLCCNETGAMLVPSEDDFCSYGQRKKEGVPDAAKETT